MSLKLLEALVFGGILYSVPFGIIAVFVYPMSRAFLDGMASARHEAHRMTLETPWYFFDPPWRREVTVCGPRACLCAFAMVMFQLFPFYTGLVAGRDETLYMTYTALGAVTVFISASILAVGFCFMLAPRFASSWALTAVGAALGIIAYQVVGVAMNFVLDFAPYSEADAWTRAFAYLPLGIIIAAVILVSMIRAIRRPGRESWFRLES